MRPAGRVADLADLRPSEEFLDFAEDEGFDLRGISDDLDRDPNDEAANDALNDVIDRAMADIEAGEGFDAPAGAPTPRDKPSNNGGGVGRDRGDTGTDSQGRDRDRGPQ